MKINDLNLESGIEVTKISENEVSYRFKCPGSDGFVSQDSLEKSGSISLCSGTIKLHVIDFGESFVKFGITYVDKQCNSKITKGMCGDQNDGCQPCEVDDGFISCCYLGQDGGEGCEECKPIESPKPDCQTGGYTYDGCIANPYCEPCEYYDGVEKVTKCCVKGRCSYGFMGTGCIPLGCGDKCLGSEDLGCPEKCPCTEYLSNYYCMKPEEEITCEEPHVCREFMSCPYERILSEYSCQGDDVCCGSYWFSITPSNPTLEDDIKITFKDKIGLTNVLLVIDSPIYENDEWGPTRTRRCKRDPEYVKEGDYHTWTWYLKNAIPSPDENNQFELDDRAGEYTVKFYYDVTERDETGCPINGEMLKQTTIMVN